MDNLMISINNLKKFYGDVKAVNGISFDVKKGEVFGLLGPNGAGKTTTIKLLLGLLEANEGELRVLGMDPNTEEVQILGDQAFSYGTHEIIVTPKDTGDTLTLRGNFLTILTKQINGSWKIAIFCFNV